VSALSAAVSFEAQYSPSHGVQGHADTAWLFGPKSEGRIGRCCTKCGICAREHGDRNQHDRRRSEGHSVQRRNSEEGRPHELRQPTGEEETDTHAGDCEAHAIAQHQSDKIESAGANCGANAELTPPLDHGVRDNTVESDRRQRQC